MRRLISQIRSKREIPGRVRTDFKYENSCWPHPDPPGGDGADVRVMGDLVPVAGVVEERSWADLLNICDSVEDGEDAAMGDDVVEYISNSSAMHNSNEIVTKIRCQMPTILLSSGLKFSVL